MNELIWEKTGYVTTKSNEADFLIRYFADNNIKFVMKAKYVDYGKTMANLVLTYIFKVDMDRDQSQKFEDVYHVFEGFPMTERDFEELA